MKHLRLIFRSLYKNDACIDGGRNYKWWVAVIFFLLSSIVSVIPITVSTFTVDAGTVITNAAFDTDKGIHEVIDLLDEDSVDIKFNNKNTISEFDETVKPFITLEGEWKETNEDGIRIPYVLTQEVTTEYKVEKVDENGKYTITTSYKTETKPYFELYVFDDINDVEMSNRIKCILQDLNPYIENEDGTYIAPRDDENYTHKISFLIFGKESFAFYKYDSQGVLKGSIAGDYSNVTFKLFSEIKGETLAKTVENFALFLNEGFLQRKLSNAGIQISIYLAINAGMILLMGLVLFIMTRGKNNPFRIYKFSECYKIASWTSFTPALLALILGFLFSTNGIGGFMFVLTYGVRTMWLAMKNLRPMQNS